MLEEPAEVVAASRRRRGCRGDGGVPVARNVRSAATSSQAPTIVSQQSTQEGRGATPRRSGAPARVLGNNIGLLSPVGNDAVLHRLALLRNRHLWVVERGRQARERGGLPARHFPHRSRARGNRSKVANCRCAELDSSVCFFAAGSLRNQSQTAVPNFPALWHHFRTAWDTFASRQLLQDRARRSGWPWPRLTTLCMCTRERAKKALRDRQSWSATRHPSADSHSPPLPPYATTVARPLCASSPVATTATATCGRSSAALPPASTLPPAVGSQNS